jgi:hypothetical protein
MLGPSEARAGGCHRDFSGVAGTVSAASAGEKWRDEVQAHWGGVCPRHHGRATVPAWAGTRAVWAAAEGVHAGPRVLIPTD